MSASNLSPAKQAQMAVVNAALSVVEDVGAGRLAPAALEAQAVAECRQLVGFVDGPADPLWELHVSIARQVLAVGGIPAGELAEWAAVQASSEDKSLLSATNHSWMDRLLGELAVEAGDDEL